MAINNVITEQKGLARPQRPIKQDVTQKFISFTSRRMTPLLLSQKTTKIVSVLLVMLAYSFDFNTPTTVQLNFLYLLPLALISLQCKNKSWVVSLLVVCIFLQIVTLYSYADMTIANKILKLIFVIPVNILVIHLGEVYRRTTLALLKSSVTDALTGLGNRRSIEIVTEKEIERQKRYQGVFSFALLDLDGFKVLNDTRGHKAGDNALKLLATILNAHIRQSDTSGRLGGDEFVIMMPNTSAEDAVTFCNLLCARIASQMKESGFLITASIGSVTFEQSPDSFETVFSLADAAMYEAKSKGKGQVVSK